MLDRRVEIISSFLRETRPAPGAEVLEVGAGTGQMMGLVSPAFPGVRFRGLEPDGHYVEYARARYRAENPLLEFGRGTLEELRLPPGSVDCAYSINVWHHIPEPELERAAAALSSALKPGGFYLCLEPNWLNPYVFAYQWLTGGERNFFQWRELKAALRYFEPAGKAFRFAYPEAVRRPPKTLAGLEFALERCPPLAGAVVYTLRKKG